MDLQDEEQCIDYIKNTNPGGFVNTKILVQDISLLKKATLFSCDKSIERGTFPVKRKMLHSIGDFFLLLKNIPRLLRTFRSYFHAASLVKKYPLLEPGSINQEQFDTLMAFFEKCGIDHIGYTEISECDVFKHLGVPYNM